MIRIVEQSELDLLIFDHVAQPVDVPRGRAFAVDAIDLIAWHVSDPHQCLLYLKQHRKLRHNVDIVVTGSDRQLLPARVVALAQGGGAR